APSASGLRRGRTRAVAGRRARREDFGEGGACGRGGGAQEVYARVHEPHRQDGRVPSAGAYRIGTDPDPRTENCSTTDHAIAGGAAVRVLVDRRGAQFPAADGYGP